MAGEEAIEFGLETLLQRAAALAREIPRTSDRLLAHSLAGLPPDRARLSHVLVLPRTVCRWKVFLRKSGTRIILRFFKRKGEPRTLMDTELSWDIVPEPGREKPSTRARPFRHRLVLPEFLVKRPTAAEIRDFAPPDTTGSQVVLFRLGHGVLAVGTRSIGNPRVAYTPDGDPARRIDMDEDTGYELRPFALFIGAVREWVQRGFAAGLGEPIATPDADAEPDPLFLLAWAEKTFAEVTTALAEDEDRLRVHPLLAPLQPRYRPADMTTRIMLRLNPEAELAEKESEEQFKLSMSTRFDTDGTATTRIGPPDFLIGGDLHAAFMRSLRTEAALSKLAKQVEWTVAEVESFLTVNGSSATLFRIQSGRKVDTNLIVVGGEQGGRRHLLVFKGKFEIEGKEGKARVEALPRSFRRLFSGPADVDERWRDEEVIGYFVRFARVFRKWLGVLPH